MIKNLFWPIILLAGILTAISLSCAKEKNEHQVEGVVDLYLLNVYEKLNGSCQIIESTAITQTFPLIKYADILEYDPDNHTFKVSDNAKNDIKNLEYPVTGTAFAIKADNEVIYTGYFWPGYSSLGCNWVVIDPIFIDFHNELKVELGYPGQIEGSEIPDKRNDERILDIFKRDGKLRIF